MNFRIQIILGVLALVLLGACGGPCKDTCSKQEECFKSDFEDAYSDMDDCVEECEEDLEDTTDDDKACGDALTDMLNCYGGLECSELEDEDSCEDEREELDDKCYDGGATDASGCEFQNDGQCDEPEGSDVCAEGTDAADCGG